jgi:hypothetical protein
MSELSGASSTQDSARRPADGQRTTDSQPQGQEGTSRAASIAKAAEPLTRSEYREQMREGPAAGKDDPPEHNENAGVRTEMKDRPADRGKLAEPLTRGEYREQMRQGPAARTESPGHADPSASADDAANRSESKVTHFHSEFKGETLDLYTDGTRWATLDRPRREDMTEIKPDATDPLPTGEELVEGAGEGDSRLEKLRRELYREGDDALDAADKGAAFAHDLFSPSPTGSIEGMPANHPYISEASHSGIDPGSMATALFTFGLVVDRGIRWAVGHYEQRRKRG